MILYIHRFVNWLLKHHVFVQEWDRGGDLPFRAIDTCMQNFGQVWYSLHIVFLLRTQHNSVILVRTLFKHCRLVVLIEHWVDECIHYSGCNIKLCVCQIPLPIVLEKRPSNNKCQFVRKLVFSKLDKELLKTVLKIWIYPNLVNNFAAPFIWSLVDRASDSIMVLT